MRSAGARNSHGASAERREVPRRRGTALRTFAPGPAMSACAMSLSLLGTSRAGRRSGPAALWRVASVRPVLFHGGLNHGRRVLGRDLPRDDAVLRLEEGVDQLLREGLVGG